jgi:spore coat protein U-like protein
MERKVEVSMKFKSNSRFLVLALLVLLVAIPSFAGTTGQLTISGSVPLNISIAVAPTSSATNLPLSTGTGSTPLTVANVTEISNSHSGYSVALSSANAGVLKEASGSSSLAYSLTYGNATISFTNGSAVITNTKGQTSSSGTVNALAISFQSGSSLPADTYSDTLTFTIAAN